MSGNPPADIRNREYGYYHCNETYYRTNFDVNNEITYEQRCKELLNTAATFVSDGAERKP